MAFNLLDKIRGAISGLRNDVQNKLSDNSGIFQNNKFVPIKSAQQSISNFAQQNPRKAQALLTYEPAAQAISHPIKTAKASLASQNIKTPQEFATRVVKSMGKDLGIVGKNLVKQYVYNPSAPENQRLIPQGLISKSQLGPKISIKDLVTGNVTKQQLK